MPQRSNTSPAADTLQQHRWSKHGTGARVMPASPRRELVASTVRTLCSVSEADTGCFNGLLLDVHSNWHWCSVPKLHGSYTDPRTSCKRSDELCWRPWRNSRQFQPRWRWPAENSCLVAQWATLTNLRGLLVHGGDACGRRTLCKPQDRHLRRRTRDNPALLRSTGQWRWDSPWGTCLKVFVVLLPHTVGSFGNTNRSERTFKNQSMECEDHVEIFVPFRRRGGRRDPHLPSAGHSIFCWASPQWTLGIASTNEIWSIALLRRRFPVHWSLTATLSNSEVDVPALRSLDVRESPQRGRRQLDNVIDALWVVVPHKCLAALSVQRSEGAAEGRLSQNTTLDMSWSQGPEPTTRQRRGLQSVCVGGVTNLLSLHSTKISCAAPQWCAGMCRMSGVDGTLSSTKGVDVRDRSPSPYISGITTIFSPSSDRRISTVLATTCSSLTSYTKLASVNSRILSSTKRPTSQAFHRGSLEPSSTYLEDFELELDECNSKDDDGLAIPSSRVCGVWAWSWYVQDAARSPSLEDDRMDSTTHQMLWRSSTLRDHAGQDAENWVVYLPTEQSFPSQPC